MSSGSQNKMEAVGLKKVFGLWASTAYIISAMIGTGIFVVPKEIYALTGSPGTTLAVWAFTAVINLVNAFCYVELGLTFPKSGSDYVFIHEAFGEFASFLMAWALVIFRNAAARAVYSLAFGTYFLQIFWSGCDPPHFLKQLIAALVLSLLGFINAYSSKLGVNTAGISSVAKLTGIFSLVLPGLCYLFQGDPGYASSFFLGASADPGDYVMAFYGVYFTFSGAYFLINVIEEVQEPVKRNVVLSVWISVSFVSVLYILANLTIFIVLNPAEILSSEAVAMTLVLKLTGGAFRWFMPMIVAFSVFGSINNSIIHGSRLTLSSARNGHFPQTMSLVQSRLQTPIVSIVFNTSLSVLMVASNSIYSLIVIVSYLTNVCIALSVIALIMCRFTRPNLERPFKLPLIIPFLYLFALVVLLGYPFYQRPLVTGLSFVILVSGMPVYFFVFRNKRLKQAKWWQKLNMEILRFCQKLFVALPETVVPPPSSNGTVKSPQDSSILGDDDTEKWLLPSDSSAFPNESNGHANILKRS